VTDVSAVQEIVGYNGTQNVRITPANFVTTGGTGVFLPLAGGTMTGNILLDTNVSLALGASSNFNMFHDGTDVTLQNFTGNFVIVNKADNKDIRFQTDNGSGGTTTYFTIDGVNEINQFSKNVVLSDNVKALFGTSSDLQIYHDGSNSYIKDAGTGNLKIRATNLNLQSEVGADYISCVSGGAVELYNNNSKKLETTTAGVSVSEYISKTGDTNNFIRFQASRMTLQSKATTSAKVDLHDNGSLYLETGGANTLTLDTSSNATFAGNIGIGAAPQAWPLEVKGADTDGSVLARFYSNTGSRGSFIIRNGSGVDPSVFIGTSGGSEELSIGTENSEVIRLDASQNATFVGDVQAAGVYVGATNTAFDFYNQGTSYFNGTVTVDAAFTQSGGDDSTFSGDVGIGTTSPVTKLHVNSSNTVSYIHLTNSTTGGTSNDGVDFGVNGSDVYLWNRENSSTIFGTNGTERMRIGSTGISVTNEIKAITNGTLFLDNTNNNNPYYLYNNGSNLASLQIGRGTSPGSNVAMAFDNTGSVGIGTTSPTAKLQVVGLAEHADNAAALTAGLTAGAFYRTGDLLKVVH